MRNPKVEMIFFISVRPGFRLLPRKILSLSPASPSSLQLHLPPQKRSARSRMMGQVKLEAAKQKRSKLRKRRACACATCVCDAKPHGTPRKAILGHSTPLRKVIGKCSLERQLE